MNRLLSFCLQISVALIVISALSYHATFLFETHQLQIARTKVSSEPSIIPSSQPDFIPTATSTSILFFGDILLARNVEFLAERHGVNYPTRGLVGQFPAATAVVANFESAMATPHRRTRSYTMQFSTPAWILPNLTELGVTHVSLANNHSLDFGVAGYQNAVQVLTDASITPFGHQTDVSSLSTSVIAGAHTVGILGLNTIFLTPDYDALRTELQRLERISQVQVAFVHWGNEYEPVHSVAQRALAEFLIKEGIDVIVGHHPHVTQDIDIIDGVPVFYSLGNFIFDQYFSQAVQEGYALHMTLTDQNTLAFTFWPVTSVGKLSQPRPLNRVESSGFLSALARRSNPELQANIVDNGLIIPLRIADTRERGMISE